MCGDGVEYVVLSRLGVMIFVVVMRGTVGLVYGVVVVVVVDGGLHGGVTARGSLCGGVTVAWNLCVGGAVVLSLCSNVAVRWTLCGGVW